MCSCVVDYGTLLLPELSNKIELWIFTGDDGLVWNINTDVDVQNIIYGMAPLPPLGSATVVTIGRYGKWYQPTALRDTAVHGMH